MLNKRLFSILLLFVSVYSAQAQSVIQKSASDAFLIIRMAEKFHVKPGTVEAGFSCDVFNALFKRIYYR